MAAPGTDQLTAWVNAYVRAWNSNDPADIRALFTDDATYRTEPFATPWRGHQEIVDKWLSIKDEPGDAQFTWQPLAVTADVATIQGETVYRSPREQTYSNLWVIRLAADGRCAEFTEWWMLHPSPNGDAAGS